MIVLVGNDHAIDQQARPVEGEFETGFSIPDSYTAEQAFRCIRDALRYHMREGAMLAWIQCPDSYLAEMLADHYKVPSNARQGPPVDWGTAFGAQSRQIGRLIRSPEYQNWLHHPLRENFESFEDYVEKEGLFR